MEGNTTIQPIDQNDRIMAALAHVTAILPVMGVIAPIIIWATQRERSEFVGFQALQAAIYQLLIVFAWILGMACYMCSIVFMIIPASFGQYRGGDFSAEWLGVFFPFLVLGLVLVGGIAFVVYGVVGAVLVLQGKDFRYLLIGSWLEGYLQRK
jgi:uncharacterized Tic20 family protein